MSEVQIYEQAGAPEAYPMEKVVEALTQLVICRGNASKAARIMGIGAETLRVWAQERYTERYIEIEESYGREIEQQIVMEARQTAFDAGMAERAGIEKLTREIKEGYAAPCPRCRGEGEITVRKGETETCFRCEGSGEVHMSLSGRELAQATYALSKIKSTNVDKVLALTGRPTNPQNASSVADALGVIREMQGMGLVQVVNQAEPVTSHAEEEK
jgi:hypothetical protein